jgi:hypothetical protein
VTMAQQETVGWVEFHEIHQLTKSTLGKYRSHRFCRL